MWLLIWCFNQFVFICFYQIEDEGKKSNFKIQRAFYDRKVTKADFPGQ